MSQSKRRERARDRKAFVRAQLRILRASYLSGPVGAEYLPEETSRRLANLERERRNIS